MCGMMLIGLHGMTYAHNLQKNPATKRLSGIKNSLILRTVKRDKSVDRTSRNPKGCGALVIHPILLHGFAFKLYVASSSQPVQDPSAHSCKFLRCTLTKRQKDFLIFDHLHLKLVLPTVHLAVFMREDQVFGAQAVFWIVSIP